MYRPNCQSAEWVAAGCIDCTLNVTGPLNSISQTAAFMKESSSVHDIGKRASNQENHI